MKTSIKKSLLITLVTLSALVILTVLTVTQGANSKSEAQVTKADEIVGIHMHPENKKSIMVQSEMEDLVATKDEESEIETIQTVAETTNDESPKEETTQKTPYKEFASPVKRFVTANALNVRSGAGTNHSAINNVKIGQEVMVLGEQGSWSKIQFGEQSGWVSSNYLAETKPKMTAEKPKKEKKQSSKKENNEENQTDEKTESKQKPTNNTLADQLSTIDNNDQLILVTSNGYSTNRATIETFERGGDGNWKSLMKVNGYIGKNGFAGNKKEGDGKTPTGKYSLGTAFGQKGNPGTKLPYKAITSDDVWVDDPESPLYNTWQSKSATQDQWTSAENMNHRLYTNGFVINYNTNQVPYEGSAIFFHVGNSYTLGCIATSESHVVSMMQWIDPAKNPIIVQTPMQDLSRY
ncbi:SH3 domain-containing protein [Allobacillus sp. SKP2-8]|uniref:SH3 domain-containing protein n=1 Tax=unclassified Allobacillus TaxID=2628859 RepID=UPI001183695C|nr:SH3 domain-containing protein [Allobacillus sp. SKP2-8]TSJ65266.1 SH3 domain-containing protein [Allobacillus sp. SKP2-8]